MSRTEKIRTRIERLKKLLGKQTLMLAISEALDSQASATRVLTQSRRDKAIRMRKSGMTHAQIAKELGYSRARAQAVTKGIKCKRC